MKYYQIVETNTATTDSWIEWDGFDLDEALKAKEKAIFNFNYYLTKSEKTTRVLNFNVFELNEDIDITDKMAIADAICWCEPIAEF